MIDHCFTTIQKRLVNTITYKKTLTTLMVQGLSLFFKHGIESTQSKSESREGIGYNLGKSK